MQQLRRRAVELVADPEDRAGLIRRSRCFVALVSALSFVLGLLIGLAVPYQIEADEDQPVRAKQTRAH